MAKKMRMVRTFARTAYIFSNQSLGFYNLNIRVRYSALQHPIEKYETFSVVEPTNVTTTTTPALGPAGPADAVLPVSPPIIPAPQIDITSYPQEITIESGWIKYPTIEVKNTGDLDPSS